MTHPDQVYPELCQAVFYEQVNSDISDGLQLISTQQYDLALKTYYQALKYTALLTHREQRESAIANLVRDENFTLVPLTQLPYQEQNQWIEWFLEVQQYVLSWGTDGSLAIAQTLRKLAKGLQILRRIDQGAIALQQATLAALQIPEPMNRADEFIQIATGWLQFHRQAAAEQALNQALSAVEQIQSDDPFAKWNYQSPIASLYIRVGLPQSALTIFKNNAQDNAQELYLNIIRQEVVRDALNRKQILFAQTVTAQITEAEYQAQALVEIAIYWANHHHMSRANRLFFQALQRVASAERADAIQSTLIQTYTKAGQINIALNAAQKLTQHEPKAVALGAIAVAYSQAKQTQQAQKVLVQLTDLIKSATAVSEVGYVASILHNAVNAQQYDLAIAILNLIPTNMDFLSQPSWYRQIVQAPLQARQINKALQLAKQIPNNVWPEERNGHLRDIAIAYGNAKQWYQATQVAAQIDNTISNPFQILTRTELAAIAPTPEEFTTQIQAAIRQTQKLEPIAQKALGLTAIAQAYLRFGDGEQTESFLKQAIATIQQVEDEYTRGDLIAQMTNYLIQQRQYSAALTMAQAHSVPYLRESSYNSIFYPALECYAFYVALQVVEHNSLPDTKASQLLAIAKTYLQLGRNEDAISLLDRAFSVAQQIADPETRMIQVSEYTQIDDESDRAHQYTRLVKLYVALGKPEQAQQVVEKAQASTLRDYLQAWISCYN
ncbi:tetratricopeptide repeat protein [Fortiea contorta]|uniref:tetratricopeptide repeat protein n=1 Tax=Fortiea contorta TaxID=1892405 RepID=UPI00034D7E05|nr:tetratricopeptide repeat protein [Fortiea contorta]